MYAEERQQAISRLVADRRRVSVAELAAEFDVTPETVRRDLTALERLGLVRRVHGGVVPAETLAPIEAAVAERDSTNTDLKDRIARAALALLPRDGGTVLFDAGSTTSRLAALLPTDRTLVAFTHALPVAARLATLPHVELHLLPGRVRPVTQAAVGADTVGAIDRLRVDVAFVGSNAVSEDHGLSTPDADEAAAKRALIAAAQTTVVLADSTKLDRTSAIRFADLDEVQILVTDAGIEAPTRARLERAGLRVVVA